MMDKTLMPPIHLWIYNHPIVGISDQIEFFFMTMQQHGYVLSISRHPRMDALNVVIENFSEDSSHKLIDFCERTGKRVAIIMTEHIDLHDGDLFFHGEGIGMHSDYMHPETQVARMKNLMDCITYIRSFFVLGDLPQLIGADTMFPGVPCRCLPFPKLQILPAAEASIEYDLAFTGALTTFRQDILDKLKAEFSVGYPGHFLSRRERDKFNQSTRIVLNVPQRPGWKWLSLMRVIAALRCGRATVSIETSDTSCISRCCLQLPWPDFAAQIGDLVADSQGLYNKMATQYESMRMNFLTTHPFPTDIFTYWALLERRHLGVAGEPVSQPVETGADRTQPVAI